MIETIVFDWGDTIMRDYGLEDPMSQWEKVNWIPGAEELLQKLQGTYKCVIATSADHSDTQEMKAALARVGADQYFQSFYSQKELGVKKPDPRFFSTVAKLEGQSPGSFLMIGNLYEKDIVGAKQAGFKTIFFNENNLTGDHRLADLVVSQLNEISIGLIREL